MPTTPKQPFSQKNRPHSKNKKTNDTNSFSEKHTSRGNTAHTRSDARKDAQRDTRQDFRKNSRKETYSSGQRSHMSPVQQNAPTTQDSFDNSGVRINKALADAGVCSRRKAEELIAAGKVFVNGERVTNLGHKVQPHDELRVDGQILARKDKLTYLLLHKPVQTMCTAHDPEGRTTIFDVLPSEWRHKRLFTVGRLDYFSEGLLLLTDDGHFAQKLAHPRYHLPKIYEVLVRGDVYEQDLDRMEAGMTLQEGEVLAPVRARVLRRFERSTLLELTLFQGINRQICRMCRDLNMTILKLVRVAQGPIELDIPSGEVRALRNHELQALQKVLQD